LKIAPRFGKKVISDMFMPQPPTETTATSIDATFIGIRNDRNSKTTSPTVSDGILRRLDGATQALK
jgi:hypothetical protein